MTLKEYLQAVRTKIENIDAWCQGNYAKTADGYVIGMFDEKACRFCLAGALTIVARTSPSAPGTQCQAEVLLHNCAKSKFPGDDFGGLNSYVQVNDGWKAQGSPAEAHANVLALLDCSIAKAEEAVAA